MKKVILLLGFLVGCAPGLTATRVEGIATYTNASGKFEEVKVMVENADPDFKNTPGWKRIHGTNSLALVDLKSAIAKANEAEVAAATKDAKSAAALIQISHLQALYRVFEMRKGGFIADAENQLGKYGLTSDSKWLAARGQYEMALDRLADAALSTDEKALTDRSNELNKAFGTAVGTYRKLLSDAVSKEACSHVRCPGDTTCKLQWGNPVCLTADYEKTGKIVKPEHVEGYIDANGVAHPGDSANKGPVTREPAGK